MPLSCKATPWTTVQLRACAKAGNLQLCQYFAHAHTDKASATSCLAQWHAFLAARSSVGELKLTAGNSAVLSGIGNHLNPLACVPADCNSLTVDEHLSPFVGHYTERAEKLQHLAVKYWEHSTHRQTSGRDPLETFGNLSHLTQLRSLKVETPGSRSGLAGLGNLPRWLTSLCIEAWGDVDIYLPDPDLEWGWESECLRRLKDLKFLRCCMYIGISSIPNLEGLTSLSVCHCGVGRDSDAVLELTNLEYLDLTGVTVPACSEEEEWQPWSKFEAWPALHVFKFAGCWLHCIGHSKCARGAYRQTGSGHDECQGSLVRKGKACCHTQGTCKLSFSVVNNLVSLCVIVTDCREKPPGLAAIANTVLEALSCLQSFHLAGGHELCRPSVDNGPGHIVLHDGYSGQLKDLKLQDLLCHTLDLGVATCLTSIGLSNIDRPRTPCELILPSSVARLEVLGNSLTTAHANCHLVGLPSLTHCYKVAHIFL